MSYGTLRPQIKSLLDSIAGIQEVTGTPKLDFRGYPAAIVVPTSSTGEYETTSENKREYTFMVRLYYETKHTGVGSAIDKLEELVDTVLDTFDEEDLKTTGRIIGINLPSHETFLFIRAHPTEWGQISEEDLVYSEMVVTIVVSIDVT